MRLTALAAALLALGACAQSVPPTANAYRQPKAPEESYKSVVMEAEYKAVRDGLELVGAQCWLDAELRAANMLVDRGTGDISFFSDEGKILTADIVPIRGRVTEVRLIGEVMDAPGRYQRMKRSLMRTVETGASVC